jgi:hypothetical protein
VAYKSSWQMGHMLLLLLGKCVWAATSLQDAFVAADTEATAAAAGAHAEADKTGRDAGAGFGAAVV